MRFCDSGKEARTVISKHNSCDSGKEHSAILRFLQGEEINRRKDISEGISILCTELNIIRSVLRIEPTSPQFTQSAKRTNEFSNQTCVFIRPTCLALSLNKKFEATLTQNIHCISVFTNQGVNHGKHRHRPFQKLAQIFVGLQLKIKKQLYQYIMKEMISNKSLTRESSQKN